MKILTSFGFLLQVKHFLFAHFELGTDMASLKILKKLRYVKCIPTTPITTLLDLLLKIGAVTLTTLVELLKAET